MAYTEEEICELCDICNLTGNDYYNALMDCLVNYSREYGPKFYEENQEGNIQNTLTIDNIRLEKKYIGKIADYDFVGIMDRVNIGSEVVTIIDYKTTKKSKSGDQARKDLQMGIYYKLAKENLDPKKKIELYIYLYVLEFPHPI